MSVTRTEVLGLLPPQKIAFDQKNPRGETKDQIEQDIEFRRLRKSVKHNNLFQPVIVRTNKSKKQPYRLVDGERRLRAALIEKAELVPVRIIEGGEREGRIAAYNIHTLRKEWDKRIEVAAIKEIIDEIKEKYKDISDTELFKELREITNHKEHDLKTLLSLLKYSEATVKKVQDGDLLMSHLVQIDSSFLSPLKREFATLYNKYGDSKLRRFLVQKAENGKLGNTRYLMDYVLKYFKDSKDGKYILSENKTKLRNVIRKFLDDPEQPASVIVEKMKVPKKSAKKKAKGTKKRKKKKTTVPADVDAFKYDSLKITKKQLSRIKDLRPKLETIASSFSNEESEYIKEGIYCLEKHCFKATALMVWATGISRILRYIANNISDFNKCSKEMYDKPKSFYKHFSRNFIRNANDVDDIRENSNDRQLLCYICYKKFIDVTRFKKLKNNYDTRNDCAHPTSISLTPNEIIVIFENVYNLLLNNSKLK